MKKERNIIIIVTIILACLTYAFFMTGYYSLDTQRVIAQGFDGYAIEDASFPDGRVFMGIICLIASKTNISYTLFYQIMLIGAIVISAFAVYKIYNIINHYKKAENKKEKIILYIISYLYIFNFMYIDSLKFIECIVMAASILLYIIGIEQLIVKNKKAKGVMVVTAGIFCYQGTIPLFIATACLVALLENKKINKEIIKKLLPCAIACIVACILNMLFVKIVSGGNGRVSQIGISILVKNLKGLKKTILESNELFPNYLWISFIAITLIIILYNSIKNKKTETLFMAVIVLTTYIVSQFILFLIEEEMINGLGRTFGAIGASFSAILIYEYCNSNIISNKGKQSKALVIVIMAFFVINLGNTLYITKEYKMANKLDKELSYKIKEFKEQEERKEKKIEQMVMIYNPANNSGTNYSRYIKKECRTIIGAYNHKTYELFTGEKIKYNLEDSKEICEEYFKDQTEEIRMEAIGDTIYIGINI